MALDLPRPTTWWTVLRIAVEERLIYRADFALGTLMRFLPIVTQIFLWVPSSRPAGWSITRRRRIAGYSYDNFIAYYL